MTDQPTAAPDAPPTVSSRRRWAGRVALLLFVVGGLFIWRQFEPLDIYVGFDVGPTMRADDGGPARRADLRGLRAKVTDKEGVERATVHLDLAGGLVGPVTPAVVVRVPRGRYVMDVRLSAAGGRQVSRAVTLTVTEPGYQRIDLDR